jgi:hypothetical protein
MILDKFKPLSLEDKERIRQEIVKKCVLVADCWLYPSTNSAGYGVKRIGSKIHTTSRFMLAYHTRESLNMAQDACHVGDCPYRNCCNPKHLQWGSHSANAKHREAEARERRHMGAMLAPIPLGHVTHEERSVNSRLQQPLTTAPGVHCQQVSCFPNSLAMQMVLGYTALSTLPHLWNPI